MIKTNSTKRHLSYEKLCLSNYSVAAWTDEHINTNIWEINIYSPRSICSNVL